MKNYITFLKKHQYLIALILIIFLAIFLRFINYENRWGLAYDQAHDALLARYALSKHLLPLLGPFSSGGPFQTGGEWYWFIMLGTIVFPWATLTPWIFLTILYVFFVAGMWYLGSKIGGKTYALMLGLLAAVSPAQITQGLNLTNQSPQSLIALLALWCSYEFLTTQKRLYLFFLAFFIGLGSSIHLQAIALLPLLIMTLVFNGIPRLYDLLLIPLGILIPWMPVFLTDITREFANTKNMIQYYLHDQYKISLEVLGRRWKTYAGVFIPKQWSYIIGGYPIFGYVFILLTGVVTLISLIKKTLPKIILITLLSTLCSIGILRYTRTPLFESYLVFLHPFILILSAWGIFSLWKKNYYAGLVLLVLVVGNSLAFDRSLIVSATNFTAKVTDERLASLVKQYPGEKFTIYTYHYKWVDANAPLVLRLETKRLLSPSGKKVGLVIATRSGEFTFKIMRGSEVGYELLDLNSSSSAQLEKAGWSELSPESIYRETQEWYHYKK
jgi:hypothetical protein